MGNLTVLNEALTKNQLPAIGKIRDMLVDANKATPVEASFIASVYAQMIDKNVLFYQDSVLPIAKRLELSTEKEVTYSAEFGEKEFFIIRTINYTKLNKTVSHKTKLSARDFETYQNYKETLNEEEFNQKIKEYGKILDEGGRWPYQNLIVIKMLENPANIYNSNDLDKVVNHKLDLLKDLVEYWVLANPDFFVEYDLVVGSDGIAEITKKETAKSNIQVDATRKKILDKIKENYPDWYKWICYVSEDRIIFGVPNKHLNDARDLREFTKRIRKDEIEEFQKTQGKTISDYQFSTSWCLGSSTPVSYMNTHKYSKPDGIVFFTFSIASIPKLYEYSEYDSSRDAHLGEVYIKGVMDNRIGQEFWRWTNGPDNKSRLVPPTTPEFYNNLKVGELSLDRTVIYKEFKVDDFGNAKGYSHEGSKDIETLRVPKGIKSLTKGTLVDFPNLETLVLPVTLDIIETGAIENCPNLKYIQVSDRFKIAENDFILLTNEQTYDNILLGVFENNNGEISVRLPKGIQYLDEKYRKAQNITDEIKLTEVQPYAASDVLKTRENLKGVRDTNRINIVDTPTIKSYKTELIFVDQGTYGDRFELPLGVKNTSRVEGFTTKHLVVDNRKVTDDGEPIRIDFTPIRLTTNLEPLRSEQYEKIYFSKPGTLTQLEVNANDLANALDSNLVYNFSGLKRLYIKIDHDAYGEGLVPAYIRYLLSRNHALLKQVVTNNPKRLYEAAQNYSAEYPDRPNKVLSGEYKIYKGTGLKKDLIDGLVDLEDLEKGKVTIKESRNVRYLFEQALRENISLNKPINSYAQLTKSLKQIGLLNNDIMNSIVDKLDFLEDSLKEYKNYDFEVKYVMLPVVLNSEIKVKVVALLNNSGIILVTPKEVVTTYEELKEDPSRLSEVNQTFSLYAEILGFDPKDKELLDIIKRAYLTSGSYAGAFDAPAPEPKEQEGAGDRPSFGGNDFGLDDDFGLGSPSDAPAAGNDFGLGEEFDLNAESYKKFSLNTSSIKDLAHTLKTKSSDIIKENIKFKKFENVLVIEVDNKNIYSLLESTPNLGRHILRVLGESIKDFPTTQLVDSFTKDGKRYFIVAECVNNNYWYTEEDEIKTVSLNESYTIPKKGNAIKLERSSIRVNNRKFIPKSIGKNIVFIRGGK